MFYVLSFIFGVSIGSFVQVVATRLNVAPIIKSHSKCLSCGEALRIFDLIPLFSYLFLRGKCRYCKSPFGKENLIVEVFYGVIYVLLFHFILLGQGSLLVSGFWFVYYSLLFIVLGVIALYDLKHTYLPALYLVFYGVLTICMLGIRYMYEGDLFVFFSPIIIGLPFVLLWVLSRGKWIGFGDIVLFLGVGAFFGVAQGLAVLLISIWLGAIVGVMTYVMRKNHGNTNTAIPFVPFIVIAFLVVLFTDIDIFYIAELFA